MSVPSESDYRYKNAHQTPMYFLVTSYINFIIQIAIQCTMVYRKSISWNPGLKSCCLATHILIAIIPYSGFVCEVLICVNYANCCKLTNFNSAVTPQVIVSYSCTFISAHCTCLSSMLVISLSYSYVSVQMLQKRHFCFAA